MSVMLFLTGVICVLMRFINADVLVEQMIRYPLEIGIVPDKIPLKNTTVTFVIKGIDAPVWEESLKEIPDDNFRWEYKFQGEGFRFIQSGRKMVRNTSHPFVEGIYRLIIWRPDATDGGTSVLIDPYRLRIQSRITVGTSINKNVLSYPGSLEKTNSGVSFSNLQQNIPRGNKFNVTCSFKGTPKIETTKVITPEGAKCQKYEFDMDDTSDIFLLSFVNCEKLVEGQYGCKAANDLGEIEQLCKVQSHASDGIMCKNTENVKRDNAAVYDNVEKSVSNDNEKNIKDISKGNTVPSLKFNSLLFLLLIVISFII